MLRLVGLHAEQCRWVICRDDVQGPGVSIHEHTAALAQAERTSQEDLRGGSTKADDDLWLDQPDLGFQPASTGVDLERARLHRESAFAALLPFEVLDRIRDVDLLAGNLGLLQRGKEKVSRRPDERLAGEVFALIRLVPDEHHLRGSGTFSKDDPCGVFVQTARLTPLRCSG